MSTDSEIVKAISVKSWMSVVDHSSNQKLYLLWGRIGTLGKLEIVLECSVLNVLL
jgi:hypothetical protein